MSARVAVLIALALVVAVSGMIVWLALDLVQHGATKVGQVLGYGSILVAGAATVCGVVSARRAIKRTEAAR